MEIPRDLAEGNSLLAPDPKGKSEIDPLRWHLHALENPHAGLPRTHRGLWSMRQTHDPSSGSLKLRILFSLNPKPLIPFGVLQGG